jgi:molybdenum cofactor cytidylyltransferase
MLPAVILAAGQSSRMGRPKALLPLGPSETFLSRSARVLRAAGADEVLVVVGYHAAPIRAAVERERLDVRLVENPDHATGQLSSLIAALEAVDRPGVPGVLVTLVDVPFVAEETVRAVVDAYRRTGAPIVRPSRDGRHGHPVLFDRAVFGDLRRADPALGAKAVLRARQGDIMDVPVTDEGAFLDIDTPEVYERLARELNR